MSINCPSSVNQYDNITCSIGILLSHSVSESIHLDVDFGDQTFETYNYNLERFNLDIFKQFIKNGNFNIVAYVPFVKISVQTKIEGFQVFI